MLRLPADVLSFQTMWRRISARVQILTRPTLPLLGSMGEWPLPAPPVASLGLSRHWYIQRISGPHSRQRVGLLGLLSYGYSKRRERTNPGTLPMASDLPAATRIIGSEVR